MDWEKTVVLEKAVPVLADLTRGLVVVDVAVWDESVVSDAPVPHQLVPGLAYSADTEVGSDRFAACRNVVAVSVAS